jgi:apolipoprotein N-acyltransferase
MVVDPVGRVTNKLAMNKEGFLIGEIHRVGGRTFYTRHGDKTILLASVAVILVGLLTGPLASRGRFRRRK